MKGARLMKRIAMFLDGTWNDDEDKTNVWQSAFDLADKSPSGVLQLSEYDKGVGTLPFTRTVGGVFGVGLGRNIRQAYDFLRLNYVENGDDRDEIFLFGFSRGAFTARSLGGMIAKFGILPGSTPVSTKSLFSLYRKGPKQRSLETLKDADPNTRSTDEQIIVDETRPAKIKFIGVWDTVGALGIPLGNLTGISTNSFSFHDTRLSDKVENAFHALALDEHRKPFVPTRWTLPKGQDVGDGQTIEQRWFVGAHSNVGGGYRNDRVRLVPLNWLQSKATASGLAFRNPISALTSDHYGPLNDSYSEMFGGMYAKWPTTERHHRQINFALSNDEYSINEWIDETVFDRWKHSSYRPKSITNWAKTKNVDLMNVTGDQPA